MIRPCRVFLLLQLRDVTMDKANHYLWSHWSSFPGSFIAQDVRAVTVMTVVRCIMTQDGYFIDMGFFFAILQLC